MGGNALKHLGVTRVDTNTLIGVYNHIYRLLNIHQINCYAVPWVESKNDHGDLDIIVNETKDKIRTLLRSAGLMIDKSTTNNIVISMPYDLGNDKLLQVDLICTPDSNWTRFFYSGGDFGLYMGRVCSANGLVFGTDGLRLRADPEINWMKDVTLTTDPLKYLSVMGYDYPPRFKTEEYLWKYILSSSLAKPWMFKPQSTNSENRSRDKQRPAVQRFQNWLKTIPTAEDCPAKWTYRQAFDFACRNFDRKHIEEVYFEQQSEYNLHKDINATFGAATVRKISPNISPEQIKTVIKDMQPMLPSKNERFQIYKHHSDIAEKIATAAAKIAIAKSNLS
jgi:hypothetical protein